MSSRVARLLFRLSLLIAFAMSPEARMITAIDSTMMRTLVMDWKTVWQVWNIGDEFMFGASILVNPATAAGATDRGVYLPASPGWYDFWTGDRVAGGQHIHASVPPSRIPLLARGVSILLLGSEIESYTMDTLL